jgi:hypothetical protein
MEEINTYSSYTGYKQHMIDVKLKSLIYGKYLKLLGEFIEFMYPGIKFDILIKERDENVKRMEWYGNTYMNLVIYDVNISPIYAPVSFVPVYSVLGYDENICFYGMYNLIDSFMPEINKHLLIMFLPIDKSFTPNITHRQQPIHHLMDNMGCWDTNYFECWMEYHKRDYNMKICRSHGGN